VIPADKPIRTLLRDGTVQAEVIRRLRPTLAKYPVNPADWTATTEAHIRMAVAVALKTVHTELEARPGLLPDESMALDVLLSQAWLNGLIARFRELGAAAHEDNGVQS
jgi:hypothetical protein